MLKECFFGRKWKKSEIKSVPRILVVCKGRQVGGMLKDAGLLVSPRIERERVVCQCFQEAESAGTVAQGAWEAGGLEELESVGPVVFVGVDEEVGEASIRVTRRRLKRTGRQISADLDERVV